MPGEFECLSIGIFPAALSGMVCILWDVNRSKTRSVSRYVFDRFPRFQSLESRMNHDYLRCLGLF